MNTTQIYAANMGHWRWPMTIHCISVVFFQFFLIQNNFIHCVSVSLAFVIALTTELTHSVIF